jgi:hypothetical protein
MLTSKLLHLSLCAIFFGSIYTIFRKYQSCAQLSDPDKTFNQPLYIFDYDSIQSFLIFVGMSTIGLFKPLLKTKKHKPIESGIPAEKYPSQGSIYVFLLPSLLDVAGTVVDTAGLFYVHVSPFRPASPSAKCSKVQSSSSPTSSPYSTSKNNSHSKSTSLCLSF